MIRTLPEALPLERPMIGLDLETTGTDRQNDKIVELALEIMRPGQPTKEYRTLINPGRPIPPGATKVHKITDADVKNAPRFEQLASNLLKGLVACDFAGYNVRFDLQVMQAEFKRAGIKWDYEDARVIDGFRLWQIAEGRTLTHAVERWLKGGTSKVSDEQIAQELDKDGAAHNALWDIKMSTRIIAAQLAECPQVLPADVQKLHDLCSPGWFDAEGKLQWKNSKLVFTFGTHRDKPLARVPESYLSWILKADFSDKVKATCRNALNGVFPTQTTNVEDSDENDID